MSREELVRELERGSVQLVNVLERQPPGTMRLIPGSIHIPLSVLEGRLSRLDRDRDVVVYCANVACPASHKAAVLLERHGFRVRRYPGGIEDWIASGARTELERDA